MGSPFIISIYSYTDMKTRLPKALLVAVLASAAAMTANANSTTKVMTPIDIIQVDTDQTADQTIYNQLQTANTATYNAVVKDGNSTLTIEDAGNLNMSATFIAREGETIVKGNTTITNTVTGAPMLMVGGLNASLVVDGATVTTNSIDGKKSWVSAIIVGGRDGDGTLKLTGGATVRNNHGLFAGGQSRDANYTNKGSWLHNCGSYATSQEDILYRNSHKDGEGNTIYPNFEDTFSWTSGGFERRTSKATIIVEDRSKLLVGYGLNLGNVDLLITGKDTVVEEGHQAIHGSDGEFSDYANRLGDTVYGGTTVTVENGATWTMHNNLWVSFYGGTDDNDFNGDTKITVGKDGVMNSLRETSFGGESYGAKTEFTVRDGGTANITNLTAGFQDIAEANKYGASKYDDKRTDNIATMTIEQGGKYTGSALNLNNASELTNEGSIVLTDGQMVSEAGFNGANAGAPIEVASQLNVNGGKLINYGSISADEINISAGELTNSGTIAGDIFMDGGVFTMEDDAVAAGLTATSGTINLSGNVTFTGAVSLGSVVAADPALALLSGSESDTLTVYIAKDTNIVLDDSILSVDGQQFVVGENTEIIVDLGNVAYAEGTPLFTLTGSNGTQLTNTAAALEDKMTVTWKDENGATQSVSGATADMSGSITTNAVPEPTTATLSLLALAGLCARRRRK